MENALHTTTNGHIINLLGEQKLSRQAIDNIENLTGVKPVIGGKHVGKGTHNAVVSLASSNGDGSVLTVNGAVLFAALLNACT